LFIFPEQIDTDELLSYQEEFVNLPNPLFSPRTLLLRKAKMKWWWYTFVYWVKHF